AIAPIRVATGEHCQNRVIFKQLLQAKAIGFCQIDACRLGGVNEVLAVLLMAAKFGVPVCPHAGGVGLCEYVQHISLVDYSAATGVGRPVLVQTISSLGETREFLATAAANEFIAGVVGWVDLTAPDLAEQLAALRAGPGGAKLVGIRHQVHDEAAPEWLGRPDVRRGMTAVGKLGLAYDILVRTRELPSALALVRDFQSMRFVVDHIAKPPITSGAIDEWAARLRPLAE